MFVNLFVCTLPQTCYSAVCPSRFLAEGWAHERQLGEYGESLRGCSVAGIRQTVICLISERT